MVEEERLIDGWRTAAQMGPCVSDTADWESLRKTLRKPELLAPAGNMVAFRAALLAGADAIYLGLSDFNARRNAENISLPDLGEACRMAHLAGRRVYLTLNTLVLESEVQDALQLVDDAYLQGIDAVIVQDIGIMGLIARRHPDLEVHTSTQMNILNREGVLLAKRLGATRVTLARELSLQELSDLSTLDVDLEVFAHGALCICYSGQCLMSSLIGRRSANRGLCAQPCRLPYELHDGSGNLIDVPGERLLSPRDLCTIDILPQLMVAGVASLKIEGRMKSADYVATVVSVYREAIDRAFADPSSYAASAADHDRLAEAFSRGFSTAYLLGERGNDMMSYNRSNNRGVLAGRVSSIRDGLVEISADKPLRVGDQLEFWTVRGRHAQKLTAMYVAGVPVDSCAAGQRAAFPVSRPVAVGDRVFRVRSEELQSSAEALYANAAGVPEDISVDVRARIGEPLKITVRDHDGRVGVAEGVVVEPARTKSVSRDEVVEHVGRLGGTRYSVSAWSIDLDDGVGLGFSQLHGVRKAAIDALEDAILEPWSSRVANDPKASDPSALPAPMASAAASDPARALVSVTDSLAIVATTRQMLDLARRRGIKMIYVPVLELIAWLADEPDLDLSDIIALIPTVVHDGELAPIVDMARSVGSAAADGIALLSSLTAAGVEVEAGPRMNALNPFAISTAREVGARRLWLSPELALSQIASLAAVSPLPFSITVFGRQELMVTEHCELAAQGPCSRDCPHCARRTSPHMLHDRKGYDFPIETDRHGRGHIYNSVELDLVPSIPELIEAGVSRFTIDASLLSTERADEVIARACEAIVAKEAHPFERLDGTTTGHIFRGVL